MQPIIDSPRTGKPLAVFLVPQADNSLDLLQQAGIAAFRTPEACADGVRALLDWRSPISAPTNTNLDSVAHLMKQSKSDILNESQAADVFSMLGISTIRSTVISNPSADLELDLEYPVAAKVLSRDIPHKTEAGAVALNICNAASLRNQAMTIWDSALQYNPSARLDGILIQPMVSGLAEVLVGFRQDPEVGPIVILSPGGVLAEIYGDAAIRPAPIDLPTARTMIEEVPGLAPIRGYRNLPKGDLEAVAQCIKTLSQLATIKDPIIIEAEINPLIVSKDGSGVLAIDALIRLASLTRNQMRRIMPL